MKDISKELDQFLDILTEVELETSSKTIFTLCESVRELELYKIESPILDSFIEWARNESRRHEERINGMGFRLDKNDPSSGELMPVNHGLWSMHGMHWLDI